MPYITLLNREWVPGRSDSSVQICAVVVSPAVALCLQRPVCWRAGTESSLAEFGACLTLINGDAAKALFWILITTLRSPPPPLVLDRCITWHCGVLKCQMLPGKGTYRNHAWGKKSTTGYKLSNSISIVCPWGFSVPFGVFFWCQTHASSLMGTWNKKRHGGEEETVLEHCFISGGKFITVLLVMSVKW